MFNKNVFGKKVNQNSAKQCKYYAAVCVGKTRNKKIFIYLLIFIKGNIGRGYVEYLIPST